MLLKRTLVLIFLPLNLALDVERMSDIVMKVADGNSNFNIEVIHSLNASLSTQTQREIFLELVDKLPVSYFKESFYPLEFTFGKHSRCALHILLVTQPAVEQVIKWVTL